MTVDEIDPFTIRLNARLERITYEPGESLRIIVREATHLGPEKEREPKEDSTEDVIDQILTGSRSIISGTGDRTVEFNWVQPIAYTVLDESYAGPEAPVEGPVTTALHVLENGAFTTYVRDSSYIAMIDGPLTEYLLITLDCVVKVLSLEPPSLSVVRVIA